MFKAVKTNDVWCETKTNWIKRTLNKTQAWHCQECFRFDVPHRNLQFSSLFVKINPEELWNRSCIQSNILTAKQLNSNELMQTDSTSWFKGLKNGRVWNKYCKFWCVLELAQGKMCEVHRQLIKHELREVCVCANLTWVHLVTVMTLGMRAALMKWDTACVTTWMCPIAGCHWNPSEIACSIWTCLLSVGGYTNLNNKKKTSPCLNSVNVITILCHTPCSKGNR